MSLDLGLDMSAARADALTEQIDHLHDGRTYVHDTRHASHKAVRCRYAKIRLNVLVWWWEMSQK